MVEEKEEKVEKLENMQTSKLCTLCIHFHNSAGLLEKWYAPLASVNNDAIYIDSCKEAVTPGQRTPSFFEEVSSAHIMSQSVNGPLYPP